ncbi:MAG TPA: division initiation protein [Clostridiales bacterium]|jgi:uncharacterized protein YlxW (UPF0749 family)|nr:division initiation protein [Clostridiales bacterium]
MLISIFLGLVLALQFQLVRDTAGGIVFSQRINQLTSEIKNANEEKNQLIKDLDELEDRLREYENNAAEESIYIKSLRDELNKYRIMAGFTDVKGPGVIVTLDNPPVENQLTEFSNNLVYNYEYILLVISNLNAAGAEAISINGQRHTNYTEIVPVGTYLNINGVSVLPPIEIKAIGNTQTLESVLNFKGGAVWEMKNLNYQVEVTVLNEIEIQRQIRVFEFRYAQPY